MTTLPKGTRPLHGRGPRKINEYESAVEGHNEIPKSVWAAIAVSRSTTGGDDLEHATEWIALEWHRLHKAGVVPQPVPGFLRAALAHAVELEGDQ